MRINRTKLFALIFFAALFILLTVFKTTPAKVTAFVADDAATTYKAKCAMCHTPTATKFYDPAKADDVHIETILKGKKGEKPPFMPGYEAKGMTSDEAKSLAELMRALRTPK